MALKFEWDVNKAEINKRKHNGITFEEASTVFSDFLSLVISDPMHPDSEERFILIGRSEKQRLLVVVHTERGNVIRLISAREATNHERRKYEQNHD
ncbi:MAG: BrnT family toxin [Thiolinea sp.]